MFSLVYYHNKLQISYLGSAFGFLLGGVFLSIYVDPGVATDMTASDPRWIGNWWIGNVIGIIVAILLSVWMLGFPRTIAKKYSRNSLGSENNGSDESHVSTFWDNKGFKVVVIELSSINKDSLV